MALAHLTGRSFLMYNVVEDTLLSLHQAQDGEEESIMLCLSHADDHVLAHYNLLVPMNEGMPGHCPRGATHAQPPEASGRQLRAEATSFLPMAGKVGGGERRRESSEPAAVPRARCWHAAFLGARVILPAPEGGQ